MKLKIAANCIRGNKRRSNEDMVLVGESFLRDGSIDFSLDNPDLFFALVSDGMGGHDHGEMASEFLLRRIREEIQPGDIFLVCTDGLYEMLPERNIQEVLSGDSGPVDSVARLSRMAEEAGGRDNISLIVVNLV